MDRVVYIVIPCYNEQEVLPETSKRVGALLRELINGGQASRDSRVMFVDDGSKDRTWEMIRELHSADPMFAGLKLSRNRGHQNALLAGLLDGSKRADVTVSMDADLQDDVGAVRSMLEKHAEGCEIVYGVRSSRKKDSFFKRFTAESLYRLLRNLGGEVVFNHADYRLMGRRALDALEQYPERNLYLRGLVPMLGYKSATVYYERGERFAGESKYPLKKMLELAFDGITSLSAKPLSIVGTLGTLLFIAGLGASIALLAVGQSTAAIICTAWGAAGLVLAGQSVAGGYIGKIYAESKRRPRYFVEELLD
ncbi:MAG: glycosyltransferase family 2 protein, partial [Oscillospiraceae bacterium]|nr:glycosyltransferase family 2 protein [Oscillospiraceae bacterium]